MEKQTYKARKMKASLAFLRLQPTPGGASKKHECSL